ncbi:hypothetical protein SAMN05421841_1786 [Chryseobacterium wanjuense]|jgi:hypothetical protein|uniref:Uncharacterized protein n=1 Tax=Chryseobacterium wanjuense TaxID=356305 RepID=A0A1I0QBB9_9FLAO|nr:hypothetical protein [Chryseobacterium wanjuense]SEW24194.1 hypothetical protein SAMN05421841_1786 [Chryseobacterium wanjuense]
MSAINFIKMMDSNPNIDYSELYKEYFKQFSKRERIDAFIYSMTLYKVTKGLFISNTELWIDFTKQDWQEVLIKNTNRPAIPDNPDGRIIDLYEYDDLIILNKFLKINPFSILLENKDKISRNNLLNCLKYGYFMSTFFYQSDEFLVEDFEDFSNISYVEVQEYSKNLITQGCEKRLNTPEELYSWLEEKIKTFQT